MFQKNNKLLRSWNQSEGHKICGPDWNDKLTRDKGIDDVIRGNFQPAHVCMQIKIEAMQRSVATCPTG